MELTPEKTGQWTLPRSWLDHAQSLGMNLRNSIRSSMTVRSSRRFTLSSTCEINTLWWTKQILFKRDRNGLKGAEAGCGVFQHGVSFFFFFLGGDKYNVGPWLKIKTQVNRKWSSSHFWRKYATFFCVFQKIVPNFLGLFWLINSVEKVNNF